MKAQDSKADILRITSSERVVLAALLRDGPSVMDGTSLLASEDFAQPLHRMTFDVAARQWARDSMPNADGVAAEMAAALPHGDVHGYVLGMAAPSHTAADILAAVDWLKDAAWRRRLAGIAAHLRALAADTAQAAGDTAEDAPAAAEHGEYLAARLRGLVEVLAG